MSEIEQQGFSAKSSSRRTIVKGAAWSVPVIAAAIAAPAASASVASATVAFTDVSANLVWLDLLNGGVASASVLGTGPQNITVINTAGAIVGPLTGVITIAPNSATLINLGGRPKAIGVQTLSGATVTNRTASGGTNGALGIGARADTTTTNFTVAAGIAGGGSLVLPIAFGYTGTGALLTAQVLQSYTATLVLKDANGTTIASLGSATLSSLLNASVIGG
ncbi:hypothetical protein [Paeniglutamicibacter sp. Y32M11]|uniref:hypothetical protein n=1 Tax=Paeniglutamicibacter sp. Y32M11 TaxID=2853258 RepID=UPI001C52BF74|nr:hypothetical protein [Paeniglutamicibacter sp. Y32M11]QXQ09656.1 hypothetical protein KUF55_14485 [Paeniglutamicibacter sp. Y32M11]